MQMFPEFYQKILKAHFSLTQYLTLYLLVLVVQGCRNVARSKLAERFPQPIKVASRVRSIQRLLSLKNLSAKKVWFPIVRELLKAEKEKSERKRKPRLFHQGYLLLVIDRSQWKERNVMRLSLVWGNHALPVYWELLSKKGSSSLEEQQRGLSPVLELLKEYKIAVIGDREFQSDCKTGGYNLEDTRVNDQRLLATILVIAMAYTWGTLKGIAWEKMSVNPYIARTTEKNRKVKRHSHFYIGCYGLLWVHSFQCWSSLAQELMDSKPHKRLFFQKGLKVLSLIQSTL